MGYIIPTLHPAHLLRGANLSDVVHDDLKKAMRVAQEGPNHYETLHVVLPSSPYGLEGAMQVALSWMRRWKQLKCPIAFDVETSGIDFWRCQLYSTGLAAIDPDGHHVGIAFPHRAVRALPWDAQQALDRALRDLLEDEDIPKILHNGPFDAAVYKFNGYNIKGPIIDTQGVHHAVQPDAPHGLHFIVHQHLDVEPWKLSDSGHKLAQSRDLLQLLTYNAKDALYTALIVSHLQEAIAERQIPAAVLDFQNGASKLATRMEETGVPVNVRLRAQKSRQMLDEMEERLHKMRDYLSRPEFNPRSSDQVREALYGTTGNSLGLTPTKYTEKDELPSTSYRAIIEHIEHPFVQDLTYFVELASAWANIFKDVDDKGKAGGFFKCLAWDGFSDHGLFRIKWNPTGQKGSRFSSNPNVQNISLVSQTALKYEYRSIFEAPPGYCIIGADKDQLELRIIACRAGVRELLQEINRPGSDPHRFSAIKIYGETFLKASKAEQKLLRDFIKNVVYASLYNAGAKTVWRTLRERKGLKPELRAMLTLRAVAYIHKSFFGSFIEIPEYHTRKYERVQTQRFLECKPLGRKRYFLAPDIPFTEVGNWDIQTEGSDHVGREIMLTQEAWDYEFGYGVCSMFQHGHDSFAALCPNHLRDRAVEIAQHYFGSTYIEGPAGGLYLTAKVKSGPNLLAVK